MTLLRHAGQWVVLYIGLILHGINFLILMLRVVLDRPITDEEASWIRDNCNLDVRDNDGKLQTGTYDGWVRLWQDRRRILHELKNIPFELFKPPHDKLDARISGFLLLLTLIFAVVGWSI